MQPVLLVADADEYSVTRSLEVYLLWLFGYIIFNNTHGNSEICELTTALKHQSSLYTQCLEVGLAEKITMVLGKKKGGERETP